jgi:putative RNA 2'-phosphotransferase
LGRSVSDIHDEFRTMNSSDLIETSKFLSYVLRHEPEAAGLQLDSEGWADVSALIEGARLRGRTLEVSLIVEVVNTSDKKRFSLSPDGQRIRAVQGHSTASVQFKHAEKEPPDFLYHGTATRFLPSIMEHGLVPGSRHHVHLSADRKTAIAVGKRYGSPVILKIAASKMRSEGIKFFQAENGVWLTDRVDARFIGQGNSDL